MAEPPYGVIWNQLKTGNVVPFLGAGASLVGRPDAAEWDRWKPTFLPTGTELAKFLADESQFPSMDSADLKDLAKVSSYYADVAGRKVLRQRLREVLNNNYTPGTLHCLLAQVDEPMLIVVTNYDTLVEQAFKNAGKPYDLVVHEADRPEYGNAVLWWKAGADAPVPIDPNLLDIDMDKTTVIYKMHGTIATDQSELDSFVITEEDYVDFLARMTSNQAVPALFFKHCRERSFLFLGYSLRDWNLRVVLRNLNRAFGQKAGGQNADHVPSWAIQRGPTELEIKLWEKRKVDIFDMPIDRFVQRISDLRRPPG